MRMTVPTALLQNSAGFAHQREIRLWFRALSMHLYRHFVRWISCMELPPNTAVMRGHAQAVLKEVATQAMHMAVPMSDAGQAHLTKQRVVQLIVQYWHMNGLMWPPTVDYRTLHNFC